MLVINAKKIKVFFLVVLPNFSFPEFEFLAASVVSPCRDS